MSSQPDTKNGFLDIEVQKHRFSVMMQFISLAMIAIGVVFSGMMVLVEAPIEVIVYILFVITTYLSIFFIFRAGHLRIGFYSVIYLTILNGLIGNTLIGWQSGINILLFLMIPAIFYNPVIKRLWKIIICVFYALGLGFTVALGYLIQPVIILNALQVHILNGISVLSTCLILAGISYLDFRSSNEISARLMELNQQLSILACRDSLTNLLNRRTMNQFIESEHVRSCRSGKPFGLIMADVDNFKHVNDEYGHAAGDTILVELSYMLLGTLRKQDLISRWGGEEFLILLPETDLEGVQIAAEKIRSLISQSSILFQGKSIRITLSIGGVVCQGQEDWDECIKLADGALYYGKNHGKNLAVFAKGDQYCVLGYSDTAIQN